MEEVEAICDRVAIIDHGKLLTSGTLEELLDKSCSDLYLRVAASASQVKERLLGLADVTEIEPNEAEIVVRRERRAAPGTVTGRLAATLEILTQLGVELRSIETREHNLERLFLELTGRKLRD
jgi:ABC-2 type transport system ATP-binding protein